MKKLSNTSIKWIVPDFLIDAAISFGLKFENIVTAKFNREITLKNLKILPLEGQHFRPDGVSGVPCTAYHITVDGKNTSNSSFALNFVGTYFFSFLKILL